MKFKITKLEKVIKYLEQPMRWIVVVSLAFFITQVVYAVAPNPGHNYSESSGGVVQGDLIYGSGADTLSVLSKNTTSTRYLSNTGTSNNPAWSAINLTNGVSGYLSGDNGGTGSQYVEFTGPTLTKKTFTLPDSSSTIMTLASTDNITGVKTFGAAGNVDKLKIAGFTSGTTILNASPTGSPTITLPGTTGTVATTDVSETFTGAKTFGSAGSVDKLKIAGFTSGTTILNASTSGSPTITLPGTTGTVATTDVSETFTGAKTFGSAGNVDKLQLAGNTSGTTILNASPTGSPTIVLPGSSGTLATTDVAETFTGVKTFGTTGDVGKLKIAGLTSGTVQLDATPVSGTNTITFPAATGTVALTTQATDTFGALTDNTTNDVSTSAHGFMPKATNDPNMYFNATGNYTNTPDIYRGHVSEIIKNPGATTATLVGILTAPTYTATLSSTDGIDGRWMTHTSGASVNSWTGVLSAYTVLNAATDLEYMTRIKTGSDITAMRYYMGYFSSTPVTGFTARSSTAKVIAFSYDTGLDGTAFWRTVTSNGATWSVQTTTQSIATSTAYDLRISCTKVDSSCRFYINGTLQTTHTSGIPAAAAPNLGYGNAVLTTNGNSKTISWQSIRMVSGS